MNYLLSISLFSITACALLAFPMPLFKDAVYNVDVPRLEDITGFDFGKGITTAAEATAYAKLLAAQSPLVDFVEHGKTWEGRPMGVLFISSTENLRRIDAIKNANQALADPHKTDRKALKEIVESMPVTVHLLQSVHGNEISGTDSGLQLAYHFAAVMNRPEDFEILKNTLIIVEIMQNPDGRDRFVTYSRANRSKRGNPDPQAAERQLPWASGRQNHYLFDMNRDWFAMTQVETQLKVRNYLVWRPQVVVDIHEMGSEESFFAATPAPPANPLLPEDLLQQYRDFGRAIGQAFDARQIPYFHSEAFDSFYPGYGESWPSLQGSVGLLFEQGSARGLRYRRKDGSLLRHQEAVRNQSLASYAVIEHAAKNRADLLNFYYQTRKQALDEVEDDKQIILLPEPSPQRMLALGQLLQKQGIEVEQVGEAIRSLSVHDPETDKTEKVTIPASALVVRLDQPAGRLARTLLMPELEIDSTFMEKERNRYQRREGSQIYDVTGWSLPLAYGVKALRATGNGWREKGNTDLKLQSSFENRDARNGYLIPYTGKQGQIIADLLKKDAQVSFIQRTIKTQDRTFEPGSLVVHASRNARKLMNDLAVVQQAHNIDIFGINSTWFDEGPALGSSQVVQLRKPEVAILWDQPTSTLSAGAAFWYMEQVFDWPVTLLRTEQIGGFSLKNYNVLIVPQAQASELTQKLGTTGERNIVEWVRAGGTLITLGNASEWARSESVNLLDLARENKGGTIESASTPNPKLPEDDPEAMIQPVQEMPERAYGALVRVNFDQQHWLAYGMQSEQAVMVTSNRIYRPLRLGGGAVNVGRFSDSERLVMSGFVPEDTMIQLAHKPFAMVVPQQRGQVIAFTEDPTFRGFMRGLDPLLSNAIFFGPAMTR